MLVPGKTALHKLRVTLDCRAGYHLRLARLNAWARQNNYLFPFNAVRKVGRYQPVRFSRGNVTEELAVCTEQFEAIGPHSVTLTASGLTSPLTRRRSPDIPEVSLHYARERKTGQERCWVN